MKLIPLRATPNMQTVAVIKLVMERPPNGTNADDMRKRVRVLDALDALDKAAEASPAALLLEDADHALLAGAARGFTFGVASRELLEILDDIFDARPPPPPAPPAAPAAPQPGDA